MSTELWQREAERYDFERDLVDDCKRAAAAMSAHVEFIGQRRAKGAGNSLGAPDAILYCAGRVVPIEFKRFKDGRLSLAQVAAQEKRAEQGVETAVVRSLQEFVAVVNGCRRRGRE